MHRGAGGSISADAVLWGEKRNQARTAKPEVLQAIDRGDAVCVDAALIGDEADALAGEQVRRIGEETIDPRKDNGTLERGNVGTGNEPEKAAKEHPAPMMQVRSQRSYVPAFPRSHVFALLFATACAHAGRVEPAPVFPMPDTPVEAALIPLPDLTVPPPREVLDAIPALATMTLREKAGQLVMPWFSGEYWSADADPMVAALRLVREEGVGGFVVGLGGSAYDLAAKFNALQRASKLPLFIAADLESGPASRIRMATAFPGNMALGASGREQDAYDTGAIIAMEGRAAGINFVFAPVVDVNNNPANPIINTRSYGEDAARVGDLGAAFIHGLREHGMLATAKHFPGHGDTGTDSHLALPVIMAGRARLDSVELVPFRIATRAGVDAVMSAHIAMPGITGGSDLPATLSPMVLDTLLRQDVGFGGLIVTDALNMGAIVNKYGAAQAAVLALKAGADILLMPTDPHAAIDAVVEAVERGEVSEARLDSSVERIVDAKARTGLFRQRLVDLDAIAGIVGIRAHQDLAQQIAQRSLVLVKDSLGIVPLVGERRRRALVISYGDETNETVGAVFAATLKAGG
ncbi:MAG TPA: glycoside hydrolase family 3 protein, partial [Gemmatimonadales bacterium]